MRFHPLAAAPLVLLLGCQPPAADLAQEDAAAIREANDRYVETALAGDWEAWAALSVEDAIFLQPNGPAVEGRAAIRAWGEQFTGMESFNTTVAEVDGVGDLAYARGTYAFTMGPDAEMQGGDNGKWIAIYERQADGSWLITRNIWNSNQTIPE